MTVSVDSNKTAAGGGAFTTTWANRPSSAPGTHLYFFTDVGEYGALFQYSGGRWRALNGFAALKQLASASSNIGATQTVVLQTLAPAGLINTGDSIRVFTAVSKSGTTDAMAFAVRVGTAGTTGDTAVLSFASGLSAASRTGGFFSEIKLTASTTMQAMGSSGLINTYGGSTATAQAVGTTIVDASANALYISVSIAGGATDSVVLTHGRIELITP